MANLINGNGNRAIYAAQDADLIASLAGNVTCIANVGNKYAATIEDANTIGLADGVIITKEGRRIQLDAGDVDLFAIPTGSSGVTNYYIIGYKLVQQADSSQVAETFVQKMDSSSATIAEGTLRGGDNEVYVSVYRVTQVGFTVDSVSGLLPGLMDSAAVKDDIAHINNEIGNLNDLNTNNKTNLVAAINEVNSLSQRHIILLGDSYVQGVGGTTKNIESVMESLYPWDVRRFYGGGSGYIRENGDNKKAVDILQDAIASTTDKDVITDVVFAWSIYNDMGAVADPNFNLNGIKTQMDAMQALVKANFPHARVTVCPGLWINNNYNSTFSKLAKWITTAAEYIGANVGYNAINWLLFESDVASSDNVHPNDNGMQKLGECICQVLNGSSPEFEDIQTFQSNFVGSSYMVSVRNGIATIRGIITKPSGASTTSIGNLPDYFKYVLNVPILLQPYNNYNSDETHYGLIVSDQIVIASDVLTAGVQYLMTGTYDLYARL